MKGKVYTFLDYNGTQTEACYPHIAAVNAISRMFASFAAFFFIRIFQANSLVFVWKINSIWCLVDMDGFVCEENYVQRA